MMTGQRLFVGIQAAGVVYADRQAAEHGDYKRLAFLPYDGMRLEIAADCPPELAEAIRVSAKKYEGQTEIQTSECGQMTRLVWE